MLKIEETLMSMFGDDRAELAVIEKQMAELRAKEDELRERILEKEKRFLRETCYTNEMLQALSTGSILRLTAYPDGEPYLFFTPVGRVYAEQDWWDVYRFCLDHDLIVEKSWGVYEVTYGIADEDVS